MKSMSTFVDFIIREEELLNDEKLGHVILDRLVLKRLKHNKPCVIILVGDSGEGKSLTSLKFGEVFCARQKLGPYDPYVNKTVVYTPLEYPHKLKAILEEPALKDINWIILDEAREVVNASQWNSFINHAIADINATSRGIKPICIIVVVQYLKDLDVRIRRTANYYGSCLRPMGHKVRLKLTRLWKDDSDIEAPRLRRRMVRGFIVKDGHYNPIAPKIFTISRVTKSVEEIYEYNSKIAKKRMIGHKLNELMKELEREYGGRSTKIEAAVEFFHKNFETVTERVKGKIKVKKNLTSLLDFDKKEMQDFEDLLVKRLKKEGIINAELVPESSETATN